MQKQKDSQVPVCAHTVGKATYPDTSQVYNNMCRIPKGKSLQSSRQKHRDKQVQIKATNAELYMNQENIQICQVSNHLTSVA